MLPQIWQFERINNVAYIEGGLRCLSTLYMKPGKNPYSSSVEEICQAVRRLLSSHGNVEAWTSVTSATGPQMKATATFFTREQATNAVTDRNG